LAEHRLDQVVSEAVQLFFIEAGVNRSCVALEIEPADYRGSFDRAAIEEISRNLLDNAVKYCDGQSHIRVTLRRVDNECILKVSDNGWGMDERVRQQIFRPYFRADTSLRAKVPGIGLGLTIVRSLVREHGGTITVHSSPAQGSTFEVRLPLNRNVFRHT
jgi:signal transduction histidine kinase